MKNLTTEEIDEIANDEFIKNKLLPTAIMLSVELESNFKLYSYRVITHEQFIDKVSELVQYYQNVHNTPD